MSARTHAQEGLYAACGPRQGREEYPAVFLPYGNVTHLLTRDQSPNDDLPALCGRESMSGFWWGTGTEREYDQARAMPLCLCCAVRTKP
jgi:hypothetical protein